VIARVLTAALLLLLLGAAAGAAALTREEALAGFAPGADPEARRRGVVWLAEHGTMSDLPRLAAALRDGDPGVRTLAEGAMWQVWSRSGDDETDRLFAVGLAQMSAQAGPAAVKTFSEVIARRPDFAEAWNKRATMYYLLGDYEKSLVDCDEVMKRNPYHFGALSGYGMIYLRLDRPEQALAYFERALAVNPNLDSVRETADALRQRLVQRGRNTL
jgi:tetratricopeptide (TPR) repeat protein